jgi:LmbE family N-acetylglucosaminyl deacetylase
MAFGVENPNVIDRIRSAGRRIILSPHLDDAVLSCGALAAEISSARTEIWTFFAGAPVLGSYSPLAKWFHQVSGGSKGAMLAWSRRREDERACRTLGAFPKHFKWYDAVYRRDTNRLPMYQACRQEGWAAADDSLVLEMAGVLRNRLLPSDVVLAPLAVGRHVDHLILRAAVEECGHDSVHYYADVPYLETYPEEIEQRAQGMHRLSYPVSARSVATWITAVMCYETQIAMLENAVGPLGDLINRLASSGKQYLYA